MKSFEEIRGDFPFLKDHVYLDTASTGLSFARQAQAAADFYLNAKSRGFCGNDLWCRKEAELNEKLAELLGVQTDEIYCLSSTTECVNMIAHAVQLKPGDEVLAFADDYPAVRSPWKILEPQGVKVRYLVPEGEETREQQLLDAINERTALVAASHVQYTTGTRLNLGRIGRAAHAVGAMLLADGTQAFGAVAADTADVDFYIFSSYKWTLGSFGLAVMAAKKEAVARITPPYVGYNGRQIRYGTVNYPVMWVLADAMDYFESIGRGRIYERDAALTDYLAACLTGAGIDVLTPPDKKAGIVSFIHPDGIRIVQALEREHIHMACRDGYMRISPHFYNTKEDIDAFMEGLGKYL